MNETITEPEVVVESDYDGYFEGVVRAWIGLHEGPYKHHRVVITSGPWRPSAVTYQSRDGVLRLDFYSALRAGFGGLSSQDVSELVELL